MLLGAAASAVSRVLEKMNELRGYRKRSRDAQATLLWHRGQDLSICSDLTNYKNYRFVELLPMPKPPNGL